MEQRDVCQPLLPTLFRSEFFINGIDFFINGINDAINRENNRFNKTNQPQTQNTRFPHYSSMARTIDRKKLVSSDVIQEIDFTICLRPSSGQRFRNLSNLHSIVITILGRNHADSMYRKSIVITKRHAIGITINFSSRPHRFARKLLTQSESAKPTLRTFS